MPAAEQSETEVNAVSIRMPPSWNPPSEGGFPLLKLTFL